MVGSFGEFSLPAPSFYSHAKRSEAMLFRILFWSPALRNPCPPSPPALDAEGRSLEGAAGQGKAGERGGAQSRGPSASQRLTARTHRSARRGLPTTRPAQTWRLRLPADAVHCGGPAASCGLQGNAPASSRSLRRAPRPKLPPGSARSFPCPFASLDRFEAGVGEGT